MNFKEDIIARVNEKLASLNSMISGVPDDVMVSLDKNVRNLEEMSFNRTGDSLSSSENIADARRLLNEMTDGPKVTQEYNDLRDAQIMNKQLKAQNRDYDAYEDVMRAIDTITPGVASGNFLRDKIKQRDALNSQMSSATARLEGTRAAAKSGNTPLSNNHIIKDRNLLKKIDADYGMTSGAA